MCPFPSILIFFLLRRASLQTGFYWNYFSALIIRLFSLIKLFADSISLNLCRFPSTMGTANSMIYIHKWKLKKKKKNEDQLKIDWWNDNFNMARNKLTDKIGSWRPKRKREREINWMLSNWYPMFLLSDGEYTGHATVCKVWIILFSVGPKMEENGWFFFLYLKLISSLQHISPSTSIHHRN